ncbi:hypothetical protein [Nonomuraea dietziae]|uniref:Uncharacterized protein n=1 Tax=Nonomuraea dietziae TaxID=65515 RepID=A0A7W5V6J7_9ACTN|nr:hypothetical protein [Nonomuraea dietziae]MBB3730064.1 hypothetical protein [Nonomuraea dietziae]
MTTPPATASDLPQHPFGQEPLVTYQGERYRLFQGRVLLNWGDPPRRFYRHHEGCVLCCTVRVRSHPGAPLRHPRNCTNCLAYTGPRPDPCWSCGKTAHHRDDQGRPTHKVCLEVAITVALQADQEREEAA